MNRAADSSLLSNLHDVRERQVTGLLREAVGSLSTAGQVFCDCCLLSYARGVARQTRPAAGKEKGRREGVEVGVQGRERQRNMSKEGRGGSDAEVGME